MEKFNTVTTNEVSNFLNDPRYTIIDIRSIDYFNGWKEKGAQRGGRIPGARSFPYKWFQYIDWTDFLTQKNIDLSGVIVLYGGTHVEMNECAEKLTFMGAHTLFLYTAFHEEWLADTHRSVDSLSRYRNVVSAEWVKGTIENNQDLEHPGNAVVICHAHYRNKDAYLSGHIPGAVEIDTLALEDPETWNRRTPEELKKNLEAQGITADTTVVLYGKYMNPDNNDDFPGSSAGHIGAIRCAMIMMYAGVKDVRVLNGGFQAWTDAGYSVDVTEVLKNPVSNFGATIPAQSDIIVDTPEAKEMILSDSADIVCVRSWPEYIGKRSGYNYIEKNGRIPGALFGNCGSDAYHMENYRNPDMTIRESYEVATIWASAGITPDKHLAFYCGTGWRGSEAFYNAWLMGWPKVSVYDGGWFEWSSDSENPYETGEPEVKPSIVAFTEVWHQPTT